MLVKGLRKLKYVDFSTSYSFTGTFLRNLGANGGGNHLEVMLLRDCMHLKDIEVERFMGAVLAGEFKLFRHLDISNREGLASEGDWFHRCYSASFIPIEQLLEERPNFCLVAEFPKGSCSYVDAEQPITSDLNSEVGLTYQLSSQASDGSYLMSTSDNSSDSDQGSDNEDGPESSFVTYEESSDEVDFLSG
ncbi:hypothetical protein OSB04_022762 [Centaurea solstitialis]|uniref:Uncharacterized protein n=1 Tax=Centaurea solstitialis TaxID=347529 RepID=A0AA38SVB2_9ASTR|nr:hypothetical protein OSB04_022762 [Centaurea solstitialis]